MNKTDTENLLNLRRRMFLSSLRHGTTHLASAFSCTEILYALYTRGILGTDEKSLQSPNRNRFILSKGHGAIALYAVLEQLGVIGEDELDTFLMPGTRLAGEPCRRDLPVIEASTGSLGHGLSMGLGMALAQKLDGIFAKTLVLLGDGECQEGSIWEAAMSAAGHHADNLVVIIDKNNLQKMHTTGEIMDTPAWNEKWKAFGWEVDRVDGHDVDAIAAVLSKENFSGKPRAVIADTIKGKGVSFMENAPEWHFRDFRKKDIKVIANELMIPEEEL